ncbi:alkylhydroperoxidase [Bordetella genomosp. 5]|uniref:Alkylhydroperoxidase n=1 Tax=Bordetella genomosp. 5 TaxID=1395608 RepID=A0A261U107_9BORD|nr:carboxymuconolactone decarboxylase family protein [Bordetella genomosp. 5]OZI47243.1 alkylhydroperoxidase [Bordetella genomosp. 5]OZI55177.1 alkylhydroperoxidase [Bordetella genomosp. 5]
MSQRLNYYKLAPDLAKQYTAFQMTLNKNPIARELGVLVTLRASQINGCAFCVDMHVKEGKLHGERELRLHHVAIWRESTLFSPRERAALAWTEVLTKLPAHGVSDADFTAAREHFSEEELSALSFLVVAINGWNRLSVAFLPVPGSLDAEYGLDKAGLV